MLKYILVIALFLLPNLSLARSYPLKHVSKPTAKCKFNLWSNLGNDCKIDLPSLNPSEYKKKKDDMFYRRIYTMLWTATYKYGWDKMQGTHLGTDIATSKGTPVYSIGDGKVVYVGTQTGRGKVVIVRHKVNGKYIYSNYAHLSKITINSGIIIKEGTKIGEVGSTGNSTGNHLHFQIDKNQDSSNHPFWFRNCGKGQDIFSIVNGDSCLSSVIQNTVDPLEFLANNGASLDFNIPEYKKEEQKKEERIQREGMKTREEIRKEMIESFLRLHDFSFSFEKSGVYKLGEYGHFKISLKDWRGRNYTDILPGDLKIIYDKDYFSAVSPRTLKILNGNREISFKTKKTGVTFFTIKLGDFHVYQKTIRIVKSGSYIMPKHGKIVTLNGRNYVQDPRWGVNVFQDNGYINIIKVPFGGTYNISTSNKNIKLCKAGSNIKKLNSFKCNPQNIYNDFNFSYSDTIYGLLVFKYFSNKDGNGKIIIKDKNNKIIAESKKLYFKNPKLIDKKTNYKKSIYNACEKGLCLGLLDNGYIWNNRNLKKSEAKKLLRNFLYYFGKTNQIKIFSSDKYKKLTRINFVNEIFKSLGLNIKYYKNYDSNYIDLKNVSKKNINQIKYLEKINFTWKDRFKKYFQINKTIKVQEALYLLNFLLEKYNS